MKAHEQGATTVSASQTSPASTSAFAPFGVFAPAMEYMVDAAQRSVLFWDVMRRRGNQYREHLAETAPHVLSTTRSSSSSTAGHLIVRSITAS